MPICIRIEETDMTLSSRTGSYVPILLIVCSWLYGGPNRFLQVMLLLQLFDRIYAGGVEPRESISSFLSVRIPLRAVLERQLKPAGGIGESYVGVSSIAKGLCCCESKSLSTGIEPLFIDVRSAVLYRWAATALLMSF